MRYFLSLFLFVVLSALLVITGCDSSDPDEDLTGPATVTGEVLDSQTGDPVEGARVTLTLSNTAARNGASRTETTNSEGIYSFENMATGTFTMLIQSDGHLDVIIE